jgi:hypothetical protein
MGKIRKFEKGEKQKSPKNWASGFFHRFVYYFQGSAGRKGRQLIQKNIPE